MPRAGLVGWIDRRFYGSYADNWDNTRFREMLLRYVRPGTRVLDYGAGRGALPQMNFRGVAAFVAGVDPDGAVLENPYLHEARVLPLPSGTIPYPDESFDVVFATNVLEHLESPESTFREIRRVLKPGGHFVAKTPNRAHYVALVARLTPQAFHEWINARRGRPTHDTFPTHYRCNSASQLRDVAAASGLEVMEIQRWEGRPEYLRFNALTYAVGLAYERIVNALPLSAVRCVLAFALRKPAR